MLGSPQIKDTTTAGKRGGLPFLSGLYGDLPTAAAGEDGPAEAPQPQPAAWSTNKAKLFVPPTIRKKAPSGSSSSQTAVSREEAVGTQGSVVVSGSATTPSAPTPFTGLDAAALSASIAQPLANSKKLVGGVEYDPATPNNYEVLVRERALKKRREEAERLQNEEQTKQKQQNDLPKPSILSLNVTGEEAWRRRALLSAEGLSPAASGGTPVAAAITPPSSMAGTGSPTVTADRKKVGGVKPVAMRMMEQMGWKAGEGLGREKQGIVAPLVARKTDKKSGVIVPGRDAPKTNEGGVSYNRAPTRVVLLMNLVGPGEVDEDLEEETAEEASKYGNLLKVKILEEKGVEEELAVRVFLEYESVQHALTALTTFEGRFFGGRVVKARFYDEAKFAAGDYKELCN